MQHIPVKGIAYEITNSINGQGPFLDGRRRQCADLELNHAECMEAYGAINGTSKCIKFNEDLSECKTAKIRTLRYAAMRFQRYKKIVKGEISPKNLGGQKYPYDSYIEGTFFP